MDDVKTSGPMFDGRAEEALHRGITDTRHRIANKGAILAASALNASIRHHGSGRAERSVTTTDKSKVYETGKYSLPVVVGLEETVVTTDLATYGPWLEGTGSRNLTTRFKGHHAFRIAGQELKILAGGIADIAMRTYVDEMK